MLLYHVTLRATGSLKAANKVVLAGSLFFYSWGEPLWICAMLFTATVDFFNGRRMVTAKRRGGAKMVLASSLIINLGILFVFKYLAFVTESLNGLTGLALPVFSVEMPIGISFYTFQSLSYVIDLYRGKARVQRRYFNYLLYVSMFPQLVAGPIVRYVDVEAQIMGRGMSFSTFAGGVRRFCVGMGKKVVLANTAGAAASALLDGSLTDLTVAGAWLGTLFFAFQIYFDFSGYSDMAIGLGKMFGFRYKENFNYPYVSRSITEFWRRWHMSLSGFFRDYVYIPLGGNRNLQIRNILVVWLLTGLWHGASWNFIGWGLYYGLLLLAEKYVGQFLARRRALAEGRLAAGAEAGTEAEATGALETTGGASAEATPRVLAERARGGALAALRWILTMLVVLYGWGIFYFTNSARLLHFTKVFFLLDRGAAFADMLAESVFFQYFWILPILAVGSAPWLRDLARKMERAVRRGGAGAWLEATEGILALALLGLCFLLLVGGSYNPFLYFRF